MIQPVDGQSWATMADVCYWQPSPIQINTTQNVPSTIINQHQLVDSKHWPQLECYFRNTRENVNIRVTINNQDQVTQQLHHSTVVISSPVHMAHLQYSTQQTVQHTTIVKKSILTHLPGQYQTDMATNILSLCTIPHYNSAVHAISFLLNYQHNEWCYGFKHKSCQNTYCTLTANATLVDLSIYYTKSL